ncbi:hypothetical protein BCU83_17790 [Vibrio breoganii]|uniref:Uncharacterized protein n=1 Tax=Vibrio breoganii TaxID=553239 RepID=A0AAN0XXM3_9VIBR|nr:hypothetical protein A6E01_15120 [Vibrio breoganii]PMG75269.1 hypothetical protein BCU83_17790 [Vibrio breoganii]PMK44428.1 hypothetical protein BCU00_09680 [Vibrio breoganii]PMO34681.1 hypothetical protein BCT12_12395 [Vibrio breoganii]
MGPLFVFMGEGKLTDFSCKLQVRRASFNFDSCGLLWIFGSVAGEEISDQCAGPEKRSEMTEGCGEFAVRIYGSMELWRYGSEVLWSIAVVLECFYRGPK